MRSFLDSLSPTTIAILAILLVVQFSLQVFALVDLWRRQTVLGGRKWIWVAIIIIGNLLGAIIYLGMGRVVYEPGPGEGERAGSEKATRRAIDDLYGDRK